MKNILLLTTMYPTPNSEHHTPVCHYFAKEWQKMGYSVKVIHYKSYFPIVFYWIARLFSKQIIKFIGNDFIETKRQNKELHFIKDDILIYSIPIFKLFPHGKYSKTAISKQINRILEINAMDKFIPDAIIGHFHNPQIEIISKMKEIYPSARSCIVLHESASTIKQTYSKNYNTLINSIDVWGFRSKTIEKEFNEIFGRRNSFICYSGVPAIYINNKISRNFTNRISKFIYIGQLIERKFPASILRAINKVNKNIDYHVIFIGSGYKREEIVNVANSLDINDRITLKGNLVRDKILNYLDNSECFIMISKGEAFGLVYLEAMARGCITIGSRNEGIDGVIKHGFNGFLCEAGNSDELANILNHIYTLSPDELLTISKNAIETAISMSDYNVAENYIQKVIKS